ncbi:hypothetical protein A0H81_01668 [Grifola frondosa]|uniref:Uncharacterized protein n=1 Tax=Grifola frondosa TaxID=5627 RepID=A0A1C7MKD0_GRIFR|nr:hypothetical protein A0H81_01668 [Grifola frondosa]
MSSTIPSALCPCADAGVLDIDPYKLPPFVVSEERSKEVLSRARNTPPLTTLPDNLKYDINSDLMPQGYRDSAVFDHLALRLRRQVEDPDADELAMGSLIEFSPVAVLVPEHHPKSRRMVVKFTSNHDMATVPLNEDSELVKKVVELVGNHAEPPKWYVSYWAPVWKKKEEGDWHWWSEYTEAK